MKPSDRTMLILASIRARAMAARLKPMTASQWKQQLAAWQAKREAVKS